MPLHSTYKLQPLDVNLFNLLAIVYQKQLNHLMNIGEGRVSMTKRFFYSMFQEAWVKAFTKKNILGAFEKTGI